MMMTLRISTLALAAALALPVVGEAATVSFSSLPAAVQANATADATTGTVYQNIYGSVSEIYRSPWESAGSPISHNDPGALYTSVQGGATATYNVGNSTGLSFVWGSPDTYNLLEFLLGNTVIDSVTLGIGHNILPASWGTDSALASFSDIAGGMFDAIRFSSGTNSFEFANLSSTPAPVPVPAAGLLLITAIGGMAVVRRRKQRA